MRTKVALDKDGLNRHPSNFSAIDENEGWYYEEKNGIAIYIDGERQGIVPWFKLRASVRRKEAAIAKAKAKE